MYLVVSSVVLQIMVQVSQQSRLRHQSTEANSRKTFVFSIPHYLGTPFSSKSSIARSSKAIYKNINRHQLNQPVQKPILRPSLYTHPQKNLSIFICTIVIRLGSSLLASTTSLSPSPSATSCRERTIFSPAESSTCGWISTTTAESKTT